MTQATSTLITWTTRAYLLTLTGFSIQEIAARSFYARKEPLYPVVCGHFATGDVHLGSAIWGSHSSSPIGAPVIAFAEIALLIESIILFGWLSNKMHEPIIVWSAVGKGVVAALIGGVTAYGLAVIVPGSALWTALLGMVIGGLDLPPDHLV